MSVSVCHTAKNNLPDFLPCAVVFQLFNWLISMGLFKHIIQNEFMGGKSTDINISVNFLIGHGVLVAFHLCVRSVKC